nr:hypothetical protein [Tanacetum cinerariifolium]
MVSVDDKEWFDHYLGQAHFDVQAALVAGTSAGSKANKVVNNGDDSESLGPMTPTEEVVDSGHSSTFSSLVEHGSPRLVQPWEIISIGADASANYGDMSAAPEGQRITGGSLVGIDVVLSYALGNERRKKKKVEVLRLRKRKAEK